MSPPAGLVSGPFAAGRCPVYGHRGYWNFAHARVITRMHAAGITDTIGAGTTIAGLMIIAGWSLLLVKLAVLLVFLLSQPDRLTRPGPGPPYTEHADPGWGDPETGNDRTG
ncbi:MAG: hypothetical protein CM1200mP20_10690 [Pseudomonadota bacterium]|nr:MAG: hypothetical protein CM1200mP20_10690 [Pseudomonadota bacterium]